MATIIHFDVPADDPARAMKFYKDVFGWQFEKTAMDYYFIKTSSQDGKPGIGGGLGKRGTAEQRIINYIDVPSIDEYQKKIEKKGGRIVLPKSSVPGMGHLATCMDTEGNIFGLWETDKDAK